MFDPLPPGLDMSVATWLSNTDYSLQRRVELQKIWDENDGIVSEQHKVVKGHIKDETYMDYKHARGINSREDVFKCAVGPCFKHIESVVYRHPAFIKHVPTKDRPSYIQSMLGHFPGPFYETDYGI